MPLWLPLVLFLTLWIKLASPGPVFFRQERIGHRDAQVNVLCFEYGLLGNVDRVVIFVELLIFYVFQ